MTDVFAMQATLSLRPQPAAWADAPSSGIARLHTAVLTGFILLTFVGTNPFADAAAANRSDGNILDRFAVLGLFGLSLIILWARRNIAFAMIFRNVPMMVLVGFCALSIVWSDYPELTLRRGMLLVFLTTIAMACVAGTVDVRKLHTTLFVWLTIIILINVGGLVVAPSRAMSDIGAKGMYTQKNVAGIVAMVTMIIGATWILAAEKKSHVALAVLAMVPTAVFLVLTRSKTSLNLAVLAILMIGFFAMTERYGRRFILFSGSLGLLGICALAGWLAVLDFNITTAIEIVIGDTSFSGRDELWAFARREAEKHAWLGHGYGAFWDVGKLNDPLTRVEPGTWLSGVEIGVINQAHHGYLELWLHVGLPATVLATLIVVHGTFLGGVAAVWGHGSRQTRAALAACATMLVIYLVHNQTEATLFMRGAAFCNITTFALFMISRAQDFARADAGIP